MPTRQFIRSSKAWYSQAIAQTIGDQPEEFMLGFSFADDDQFDKAFDGEFAIRYHPDISAWRLEAFDDGLHLVKHFSDVLDILSSHHFANYSSMDALALERALLQCGVVDSTAIQAPAHPRAASGPSR